MVTQFSSLTATQFAQASWRTRVWLRRDNGKENGSPFFLGILLFLCVILFLFLWFLIMCGAYCSSLWFCLLVFAFCFLLLAFCFPLSAFAVFASCFRLSLLLLSACCFWLHAFCFLCLVLLSAFCFLLLCVWTESKNGCNKTIAITTATITVTLTKDSHYSSFFSIVFYCC